MAIFALPWIEPENYEAFRRLMGTRIPDAYEKWLQLHTQQSVNYRASGHQVQIHEVRPDDFAELCRSHGTDTTRGLFNTSPPPSSRINKSEIAHSREAQHAAARIAEAII